VCLGIPGKILESYESQGLRMAKVQFGGIVREACLHYVPEASAGDYVSFMSGLPSAKSTKRKPRGPIACLKKWANSESLQLQKSKRNRETEGRREICR
jgi:hydrogenase expression/formation protein HypC